MPVRGWTIDAITSGVGYIENDLTNVQTIKPSISEITVDPALVEMDSSIQAYAMFTDPDFLDTQTAEWNWGDGLTSVGTVTQGIGCRSVSGTHSYSEAGVYTVTLTVTDSFGVFDTAIYQYVVFMTRMEALALLQVGVG